MTRPAVFLDRDGVLNEPRMDGDTAASPRTMDEFILIEDAIRAANRLHSLGFVVVVVTNQPDIGRKKMATTELETMHACLRDALPGVTIEVCPHAGDEPCDCRKPRPGLITNAAARDQLDLYASWTIGDRWVDVGAGQAAGTRTILIERPWSWRANSTGAPPADLRPDATVATLSAAADTIVAAGSGTRLG